MTDWTKVGENAADKTDKELAAGIERLITSDIGKLFPVPADAAKIRLLCQHIRVKTAYNERVAAFKAISATLGGDLLTTVKKAMFPLILMVLAFVGQVGAQEAAVGEKPPLIGTITLTSSPGSLPAVEFTPTPKRELPPPMESVTVAPSPPTDSKTSLFDFGDFFANVRGGYAMNQHMELSTVFYTPWKVFHTADDLTLASINLGYDGLQKRPLVAIGLRADNIDSLLWNGKWGKAHVTTAKLPSLEFGPFVSLWPVKTANGYKLDVSYGAALAIGFSIGSK